MPVKMSRKLQRLEDENRAILSHCQHLQAEFEEIIFEANDDEKSKQEVVEKLRAMKQYVAGMGRYLSFQLDPKFYNEIRKADSTTAAQVFQIPELAELIMSFSAVQDILAVEQVSKMLRDIIDKSSKLQELLFLKAIDTPSGKFRYTTPFHSLRPRQPRVYAHGGTISYVFSRPEEGEEIPMHGSKWMKMYASQPPIKTMSVTRSCIRCNCRDDEAQLRFTERYITVGDVWAAAEKILAAPKLCSRCALRSRNGQINWSPVTEIKRVGFEGPTDEERGVDVWEDSD